MSDKIFMKEITLPIVETGENETYSFVQTDADLDTAGDAADAKAVGDEISALKQDLGELDVYTLGLYPQIDVADTAVASFTDGAYDIPVKSLTVDITPVQSGSGDPSPENVRPISGWTGAKVTVTGKNLVDKSQLEVGAINANGADAYNPQRLRTAYTRVLPNTTYCISATGVNTTKCDYVFYYDQNKTFLSYTSVSTPQTFTTPSGCEYVRFTLYNGVTSIQPSDVTTLQLEEGSTASAYEPFGTIYPITFPTSAGTVYGGTLDVTNGVLTVTNGMIELDGTQEILGSYYSSNPYVQYRISALGNAAKEGGAYKSNRYKNYTSGATTDYISQYQESYPRILIRDSRFGVTITDNAGWNTWLASNHVQFMYELATPVTYQLTPTEVTTLLRNNNIFADTGNINELTYRADLKAYIDEKLA